MYRYESARVGLYGFELAKPKVKAKPKPRKAKAVDVAPPVMIEVSEPGKRPVALLLANKFDLGGKKDPTGWWMSEKRKAFTVLSSFNHG